MKSSYLLRRSLNAPFRFVARSAIISAVPCSSAICSSTFINFSSKPNPLTQEQMTPLSGNDIKTEAESPTHSPDKDSTSYRLIAAAPATSADWIKIAIGMHANEIVLVKVPSMSNKDMPLVANGDESTIKVNRMGCVTRGMQEDIFNRFAGSNEELPQPTLDNAASDRWNIFGSMFSSREPQLKVNLPSTTNSSLPSSSVTKTVDISAVDCFMNSVTLNPRNGSAWSNLGAQMAEDGTLERTLLLNGVSTKVSVLECFKRAVECNPTHGNAWFNLCLQDTDVDLQILPSRSSGKPTALTVSRDLCFVKALTANKNESYNLFLTGKSLLELPAAKGGHFANKINKPFNVQTAVVETLEGVLRNQEPHIYLSLDVTALWYFAAECLTYTVNHQHISDRGHQKGVGSDDKSNTVLVCDKPYTAKECLIAGLEYQAEIAKSQFTEHSSIKMSSYTSLCWELLAPLMKDDESVIIGGQTYSATEVFSNQYL